MDQPGADPATPVLLQSFSEESLRILRSELGSRLPTTFLIAGASSSRWLTREGLTEVGEFATGIGPAKNLLREDGGLVNRAQELGLTVIPWTFRASSPGDFPTVEAEMTYYLDELGVDGLFTNNPDLFPRPHKGSGS